MILALSLLGIGIAAYSISQLQQHGKFKYSKKGFGFWDYDSYLRKYKNIHKEKGKFQVAIPLDNWYYNTFNIKYQEAWPTSATFTVMFTDSYHLMQSLSFLSLSACVSLLSGISFWDVWIGVLAVHSGVYRVFQK